jgi:stage V sporulation protein SpoVS
VVTRTDTSVGRSATGSDSIKVLFSVLRPTVLKNFESVIRTLSARGHEVDLLVHSRLKDPKLGDLIPSLAAEPGVTLLKPPRVALDARAVRRMTRVRASLDYLRFLEPRFIPEELGRLESVPRATRWAAALPFLRTTRGRRLMRKALAAADRTVRTSPGLVRFLQREQPDVVLFTPYVERRGDPRPVDIVQPELLRAARSLRIPTAVCVASWDHLTLKSSLCPVPDRVVVWNEIQRAEATELHNVRRERVVVTGAQCYDEWFTWTPRPRGEFCARVGLDPARPYVLYTCLIIPKRGPSEADFVLRWLGALRADADPLVSRVGALVRPHPGRTAMWHGVDVSRFRNAALFPREHGFPTDVEAKSDYFDSIFHSSAVVGLNTSAMLEAGVIGRPVLTVLEPAFERYQMGLPHFRYLLEVAGGLVHTAHGLDEHVRQLADALGPGAAQVDQAGRAFVREFLRPHGLEIAATPIFVDEIERLASRVTS